MKAVKLYKFQFFLYLFIIVFQPSVLLSSFKEYNYGFSFYETFVNIILVTSVITILLSIIILIIRNY
jgi:hypothetical protein